MSMRRWMMALTLALVPWIAEAAGEVNPSTLLWNAPTTNADGTPLNDLGEYRVRVAGPAAPSATAPSFNPTVYPVKHTVVAPAPTPLVNSTVTIGTAGSRRLSEDQLMLTVDGQYWLYVTAVDLIGNESAVQASPVPFVRNRLAPAVPSGLLLR